MMPKRRSLQVVIAWVETVVVLSPKWVQEFGKLVGSVEKVGRVEEVELEESV